MPGDRKDDIGYAIGEICAKNLDKIIIKEDKDKRGRKSGEVAEILKKAVLNTKKNAELKVCLDEVEALKYAIRTSQKDDVIIVFYEKLEPLLEIVKGDSKEFIDELEVLDKKRETV